jgi:hypothetical protein
MRKHKTWIGIALAALFAVLVLFTVVLPAERGYDPTGIGKVLGLTAMSGKGSAAEPTLDEVIEDVLSGNENLTPTAAATPRDPLPLPNPAVSQIEGAPPKTETLTIKLGFDEKTEIKAVLGKAKAIVYSWSVEGDGKYWVRYEEADGISGRSGSLVAPFAGEHGWFWLNVSEEPITIKLTVTGYYEKLVDYGLLQ